MSLFSPRVPELEPERLVAELAAGEPLQVLDIRAPQATTSQRIEVLPPASYLNLPGSRLFALRDLAASGLDPSRPVAVVCGHGVSSRQVVAYLASRGYSARSLAGGMARWAVTVVARDLTVSFDLAPGLDRILQLDRVAKGALGYVLIGGGEALLVDVPRDPAFYLEVVASARARVVGVLDTHCHADYLSCGPALAAHLCVPYHLHPADAVDPYDGRPARFAFSLLRDGQEIALGAACVRVEHTPGHTAGSVSLRLGDAAVLTGDFVFVGSIGRPDLAGKTEEWTRDLWASLERARRKWPDGIEVLPAHYASDTERRPDGRVAAAWGALRGANPGLALADEPAFAAWVAARGSAFPEAYRTMKLANLGLVAVDEEEAQELEGGRNQCALAG